MRSGAGRRTGRWLPPPRRLRARRLPWSGPPSKPAEIYESVSDWERWGDHEGDTPLQTSCRGWQAPPGAGATTLTRNPAQVGTSKGNIFNLSVCTLRRPEAERTAGGTLR